MAANDVASQPAAIVLVGGRSTRMGTDKASLVVDGIAMRDRVVRAVHAAGIDTVVVAGTDEVPDAPSSTGDVGGQGPMAGIVSAWQRLRESTDSRFDPVVVLSCDLPWLVADVVNKLVMVSQGHRDGAVAHDGERLQPLVAAYRPRALDAIERGYEAGERSVRRCSIEWDLGVVSADRQAVADADTPEDLRGFTVEWPC